MPFLADKQTLEDLDMLGAFKPHSIYSLFNTVHTRGGERLLQDMFQHPLSDPDAINARSRIFTYFQKNPQRFPFSKATFEVVETYLGRRGSSYPAALVTTWRKKLMSAVIRDEQYRQLQEGLCSTIGAIRELNHFTNSLPQDSQGTFAQERLSIRSILDERRLQRLYSMKNLQKLTVNETIRYDHLIRSVLYDRIEELLRHVYHLDVYIAVSGVANANQFTCATAITVQDHLIHAHDLRHPRLTKGVGNAIYLNKENNLLFLTGANMAGKSTFMKSIGIAVYLAHLGFPVAANNMTFSVLDGLYSSINVPDNLQQGYSHFYAEVLRVKKVAEQVSAGKRLIVLFDELFKGTNVKDAYDATLAVARAFASYRRCFYILSTHIIEVGHALGEVCSNVEFSYMPTEMEGSIPRYTYQRKPGITSDRQGMIILENERIFEMLND